MGGYLLDLAASRSGDCIWDCLNGMLTGDLIVLMIGAGLLSAVSAPSRGRRWETSGGLMLEVVFFLNVNFLPSMVERQEGRYSICTKLLLEMLARYRYLLLLLLLIFIQEHDQSQFKLTLVIYIHLHAIWVIYFA